MYSLTRTLVATAIVLAVPALAQADVIDDEPTGAPPVRREAPAPAPPPPPRKPAPPPAAKPAPAPTPAPAVADEGWQFSIAPYLWLPRVEGTSVVDGVSSDIDATFKDIVDEFDVFGLNFRTEAHKSRLGLFFDFMWMDLDGEFGKSGVLDVNPDIQILKTDFGVMYTVLDRPVGSDGRIRLTPYVGGRWTRLKQIIRFDSPVAAIPNAGDRQHYWEPLVGGRIAWQVNGPLTILVQGDAGGFGIGSASDLTWQAGGAFSYRFSELFSLNLGYFAYDVDYSRGSGSSEFAYDMLHHGPRIGFQFDL